MERTLGEREITASHRPWPSVEEARAVIKELIEEGYWVWTNPDRTPDDFPIDEPLPVEETGKLPTVEITQEEEAELLAFFGVVGEREEGQRVVKLSANSDVVCPLHERELIPDVCRSCSFLAGVS